MKLEFTKMHGAGNDYVYVDCFKQTLDNPSELAVRLSDRHKGIGADGLILIVPSQTADVRMIMYNADGSEGGMCGNGARCVAKYAFEHGIVAKTDFLLETKSGMRKISLRATNGKVQSVTVDMLAPKLLCKDIPMRGEGTFIAKTLNGAVVTCVSMGNPHCVIFTAKNVDEIDVEKMGRQFENNPVFTDRANVEFVNIISDREFAMRVWERGSGETMACGTGASAVCVAAVLNGYAEKNTDIIIHLRGGNLSVRWAKDDSVYLTGEAVEVFSGTVEI